MPSAPPDVSAGMTGHITHHNTIHDFFQYGDATQYVRASGGSDSNDGNTVATAKATLNAAYNALPSAAYGGRGGTIHLGHGIHDVTSPILYSERLRIVGRNTCHDDGSLGTIIRRANVSGMDGRGIFEPYPSGEVWHHFVSFENVLFHGNRTASLLTTPASAVYMAYPGMNCQFVNCHWRYSKLYGLDVMYSAETLALYNPGSGRNQAGFMIARDGAAPGGGSYPSNIAIFGGQLDCNADAVASSFIVLEGRTTSPNKHLAVYGTTFEGGYNATSMYYCIRHRPVSGVGWNITAGSCGAWSTDYASRRFIYEEAGAGSGCQVAAQNSRISGGLFFQSAKYGVSSPSDSVIMGGYKAGNASWTTLI